MRNHGDMVAARPGFRCRAILASAALALTLAIGSAAAQSSSYPHRLSIAMGKSDTYLRAELSKHAVRGWTDAILWIDGQLTADRKAQLNALHVDVYRNLPVISSLAVRAPKRVLPDVAALPFVKRLSADASVVKNDEFIVESSGADVAFSQYKLTGAPVTVAVLDSGVDPALDLRGTRGANRIVSNVSFVTGHRAADDDCGHGTHVAGIVAGNGASSTGKLYTRTFRGIARRARIANVKVLDQYGRGRVSSVLAGIVWTILNHDRYGIRVMNISFGHPVGESFRTDPLCRAAEVAWQSGIVVVCAAGNSGRIQDTQDPALDNEGFGTSYGSIQSPANDPFVITVGATKSIDGARADDRIATYSSRGPSRLDFIVKPDIVAPGNRVISLDADNSYLGKNYDATNQVPKSDYCRSNGAAISAHYFRLSGTSMAAPVVSGAVALLLEADPSLRPDTVKARLMIAADKMATTDGTSDPCTFGAGYLNIPAALTCTYRATQWSLSPMLVRDDQGNVSLVAYGDVSGTRAIWGGFNVSALRAIWGPAFTSASNVLEASRAIWGQALWFDNSIWDSSDNAADLSMTAIQGEK